MSNDLSIVLNPLFPLPDEAIIGYGFLSLVGEIAGVATGRPGLVLGVGLANLAVSQFSMLPKDAEVPSRLGYAIAPAVITGLLMWWAQSRAARAQ